SFGKTSSSRKTALGVTGIRSFSFLLTHASRASPDRCTSRSHDPACHSVCAHVGSSRAHRLAVANPDCVHDELWCGDGKVSRGSVPRRLDCEEHGPVWANGSTGRVLHDDSCAYAADVESGRGSGHAADFGEDCARTW